MVVYFPADRVDICRTRGLPVMDSTPPSQDPTTPQHLLSLAARYSHCTPKIWQGAGIYEVYTSTSVPLNFSSEATNIFLRGTDTRTMFYANTYLEYGTRLAGILLAEQMQK